MPDTPTLDQVQGRLWRLMLTAAGSALATVAAALLLASVGYVWLVQP